MMNRKQQLLGVAASLVAAFALSSCGALGDSAGEGGGGDESSTPEQESWSFPALNRLSDGSVEEVTYEPLPAGDVAGDWSVCVLFPHMKDAFWVSANYGTLNEAQRAGVSYSLFESGGYPNIDKQISQFQDCLNGGYDAIVVGANNADSLCPQVDAALEKGVPVVDLINGMNCPSAEGNELYSRAAISYKSVAEASAAWLIDHVGGDGAQVGVFPGPEGAGWSDEVVAGWNETTEGTDVTTIDMRRGDYGVEIQQGFIQDSVLANPEIEWIFGLTAAAQGGLSFNRQAGDNAVQILSGNSDPVVYEAVLDGSIAAAGTDWAVIQGKMGMDQAVRMLEKAELPFRNVGPKAEVYTKDTAADFDYELLFGPKGFEPTYTWSPS
jgi:protein TorT